MHLSSTRPQVTLSVPQNRQETHQGERKEGLTSENLDSNHRNLALDQSISLGPRLHTSKQTNLSHAEPQESQQTHNKCYCRCPINGSTLCYHNYEKTRTIAKTFALGLFKTRKFYRENTLVKMLQDKTILASCYCLPSGGEGNRDIHQRDQKEPHSERTKDNPDKANEIILSRTLRMYPSWGT